MMIFHQIWQFYRGITNRRTNQCNNGRTDGRMNRHTLALAIAKAVATAIGNQILYHLCQETTPMELLRVTVKIDTAMHHIAVWPLKVSNTAVRYHLDQLEGHRVSLALLRLCSGRFRSANA